MSLNQPRPILYLITRGATTADTRPDSEDFLRLLLLIKAAVTAGIQLIQIREKNMNARTLCELTSRASALTRGTNTKLLVNDRADIARVAGADGVQLTSQSVTADVIRRSFGSDFLIGVSTHSLDEAQRAREQGADFVVFGPVFETESKKAFGQPQGIEKLSELAAKVDPLPVIAIGGISLKNAAECLRAGASGIAAIRLYQDAKDLSEIVTAVNLATLPG
jgi:thiamine-phosphate pyrophosphorylase